MPNTHSTLTELFTDIADAIRAKTGGTADIVADEFPNAIGDIEPGITPTGKITITENDTDIDVAQYALADVNVQGGGYFFTAKGIIYTKPDLVFPDTVTNLTQAFSGIAGIVNISGEAISTTSAPGSLFDNMPDLESVILPKVCHLYAYAVRRPTTAPDKLRTATFGSIGFPVVVVKNTAFANHNNTALVITMYVNASSLAEAQSISDVGTTSPWGATNATIIYRSSTTGEVLT